MSNSSILNQNSKKIVILQLNDLHGYLEPHWEMVRDIGEWSFKKLGGLARIAEIFRREETENPGNVCYLDNGDTFHGTHVAVTTQGQAMIPIMNALKFDAMTVHWEFAYGPSGVKSIESKLNYPVLATNCFRKKDDQLFFEPYRIIERGGLKIGIIGLACPIVDKTMPPSFSEGIYFTIGNETLPAWIKEVRSKNVNLVVVLSHLGFPQDVKLANEVSGIDILVSGHTHNRMDHAIVENGTIIFQSGCHGSFIGKLEVEVSGSKITRFQHSLISVDESWPEDPAVHDLVEASLAPNRKVLDEVVGRVSGPLYRYSMISSPMDDVLLEAIAESAGTTIAFSNGWRYGAPIPPGPVTVNDLWNIIPTNPFIQTVELSGAEIWQMIEENLERTFAVDPYDQMGGYIKRMRGVTLFFKVENPKGRRVDRIFIMGKPVDLDRYYHVAFITAQGVPIKFGRSRKKLTIDAISALKSFFKSRNEVLPTKLQNIYEI